MAVPFAGRCPACGTAVSLTQQEARWDAVEASGSCPACGRALRGRARIDYQGYLTSEVWIPDSSGEEDQDRPESAGGGEK